MLTIRLKYSFSIIILLFICTSCVQDIATGNINKLELTPIFEADFIYSKRESYDFKNLDSKQDFIIPELIERDTTRFPILGNSNLISKIKQIEFYFEIRNSINDDFEIELKYLSESNELINNPIRIAVKKGNGPNTPFVTSTAIDFLDTQEVQNLSSATKVVTTISATNIKSNASGSFELRSKGTYYILYEL